VNRLVQLHVKSSVRHDVASFLKIRETNKRDYMNSNLIAQSVQDSGTRSSEIAGCSPFIYRLRLPLQATWSGHISEALGVSLAVGSHPSVTAAQPIFTSS